MDKNELIITALKQRLSEVMAGYEMQIANLRADYTILVDSNDEKDKTTEEISRLLNEKTQIEETLRESIRLYEEDIRVLKLRYEKLEKTHNSYKKKTEK